MTFTIEVKPALAEARARLKRINESVLPELSRTMWGVAVEAVTGRLENSGPGEGLGASLAQALRAQARDGAQEAREEERSWRRKTRERTQEEKLSWRKALEGRTFVLGLGASGEDGGGNGGSGYGGAVVWGGGTLRSLSLDKPELDWSGELFSAHVGVDAPLGERLRGGVAATWSEGEIEYTDRSGDEAIAGVHESRMTTVHPYAGWSGPDGSLAWGTLGYGKGEIEIADAEVVDRFGVQTSDSAFLGAALGGSIPVLSAGGLTLSLRGSGEATRYSVEDNGEAIAAVSVDTRRLRLSVQGSRRYALGGGGTLTPSLEAGGRWDGGDGETGAGLELGVGLEWTLPSGLSVEARGRTLAAHAGDAKEWGVSGSARLSPGSDGRGLSFELAPRWGDSESGLGRLWEDGAAGRASPVGGPARLRLDTELGYGYGVRGRCADALWRLRLRTRRRAALPAGDAARPRAARWIWVLRPNAKKAASTPITASESNCASGGKGARLAGRDPLCDEGGGARLSGDGEGAAPRGTRHRARLRRAPRRSSRNRRPRDDACASRQGRTDRWRSISPGVPLQDGIRYDGGNPVRRYNGIDGRRRPGGRRLAQSEREFTGSGSMLP